MQDTRSTRSRARALKYGVLAQLKRFRDRTYSQLARWHRRFVSAPVYIGITGSAGKSTTKEILVGILSTKGPCAKSPGTGNTHREVELAVHRTTRKHRFSVIELSAGAPGYLERSVAAVRPSIGILTVIAREHYSAFKSLEAIAAEKEKLIRALPFDGIAVLNRDDSLIRAIGNRFKGRIIWVGRAEDATLRLLDARSCWPEPLNLDIAFGDQRYKVRTSLHGTHLSLPVLCALAAAVGAGVPLTEAIASLAKLRPMQGRMQIESTRDGVVFVRDDWKAPHWSFVYPLEFLRTAQAKRKIAVVGSISDSPKSPRDRYSWAARQSLSVADLVVLVGSSAEAATKLSAVPADRKIVSYATLREAAIFLRSELCAGDLVLLKGTNRQDHLVRLLLDRERPVQCWEMACGLTRFCGSCDRLHATRSPSESDVDAVALPAPCPSVVYPRPIFVGVGNLTAQHAGTRHNVGQRMLDSLAKNLGGNWHEIESGGGAVSIVQVDEHAFTLYKPVSYVNQSGAAVRRFLESIGCSIGECVIVLDDADLPLGAVRRRPAGGDGGHKGMRSIIREFGTERVCRVRIGVRPLSVSLPAKDFVLTLFGKNEEDVLEQTIPEFTKVVIESVREIRVALPRDDVSRNLH